MRRFPASVNVITTNAGGTCQGFTATAVSALSDSPPTLLVCVNSGSRTFGAIRETGAFAVNVLAAGHVEIARIFAQSEIARRAECFRSGRWSLARGGSPVLENAIVAFDCALRHRVEYATHSILIGEVVSIFRGAAEADNLLYVDGGFGTVSPLAPPRLATAAHGA